MAITRVGEAATKIVGTGTGTVITTAIPAGVTAGDFLLLEVGDGLVPGTLSDPAGWTFLRRVTDPGSTATSEAGLSIWWKIAATNEPAPSITSTTATRWHTCIKARRGVNATAPFLAQAAVGEAGGSGTTAHSAPVLTNTDSGAWGEFTLVSRQVATPYTAVPGVGLTERVDQDNGNTGTANTLYFTADSNGPVAAGSVTYSATGSAGSAVAIMWAALLAPATVGAGTGFGNDPFGTSPFGGTPVGGVVEGATATATAAADGGTATAGVSVTGVTATATAAANAGSTSIPVSPARVITFEMYDPYTAGLRKGFALRYWADAYLDGVPVVGAQDLRPVGGSITDTTRPGVRRTLNLELAPEPGLYDLLSPVGMRLVVTCRITYTNRSTIDLPMGVFGIDSVRQAEGGGSISVTAPDRWAEIQRARFLLPDSSTPGVSVQTQIGALIRSALGEAEPIVDMSTSTATMGALVWEKDRDEAILKLAKDAGLWVYFDRRGMATIADAPTIGDTAEWLIDAGPAGVLVEVDREKSRADAANVVVVESSSASGALFATQIVWDDDVNSPTYAGINPLTRPETAGPFGIVPYYFDSPVLTDSLQARHAGYTILARVTGLSSQISLGSVPNPAMDAFDVIDVLPPRQRYDIPRTLERHVVDTVTHPLTLGAPQQIEGRSTRSDEIQGGS